MAGTLLLIDDDELTRMMLGMLLEEDGWRVLSAESGESAVAVAAEHTGSIDVVLSDLQMPGLAGKALADALRAGLPGVHLLAMTATIKQGGDAHGFDALLEKPVDAAAVWAALHEGEAAGGGQSDVQTADLDEGTWEKLSKSMQPAQLNGLFAFALDDGEKRVALMQAAREAGDDAALRREAHALKGSAGMIGALRLQALSAGLEGAGLSVDAEAALDEIVLAIGRLRSMLAERGSM